MNRKVPLSILTTNLKNTAFRNRVHVSINLVPGLADVAICGAPPLETLPKVRVGILAVILHTWELLYTVSNYTNG